MFIPLSCFSFHHFIFYFDHQIIRPPPLHLTLLLPPLLPGVSGAPRLRDPRRFNQSVLGRHPRLRDYVHVPRAFSSPRLDSQQDNTVADARNHLRGRTHDPPHLPPFSLRALPQIPLGTHQFHCSI